MRAWATRRVLRLGLLAAALTMRAGAETLPFAFGVLTDVQYADKNDAGARSYRHSLGRLEACATNLNARNLLFVIHLGDLMDGYAGDVQRSEQDLDTVLTGFRRFTVPVKWVIGNHCLTARRPVLLEKLGLSRAYYDFTDPHAPGWRFVVLDENYGGGGMVGPEQWDWLTGVLTAAQEKNENVLLFGHYPLEIVRMRRHQNEPPSSLLQEMASFPCVVASFAGHVHGGGYVFAQGIHCVTVKGMVEAKPNAYAVVEVSRDALRITGFGAEPSRMLLVRAAAREAEGPGTR